MTSIFLEVVVAPSFEPAALEVLTSKKNLRVLTTGGPIEISDDGGGAIARWAREGHGVHVLVVTRGRPPLFTQEEEGQLPPAATQATRGAEGNGALLDGHDIGVLGQLHHRLGGNVDARGLRPVVNHDRDLRLVRHSAEVERLRVLPVEQVLVVVRRANHGRVVTKFGGVFAQTYRLDGRFDASPRNHDFVRRGGSNSGLENFAPLFVGEQNRFSG